MNGVSESATNVVNASVFERKAQDESKSGMVFIVYQSSVVTVGLSAGRSSQYSS